MTREFEKLMELLGLSVFGQDRDCRIGTEDEKVLEVALAQGVFPLAYGCLDADEKAQLNPKWEQLFFHAIMKNQQKMMFIRNVTKRLEEKGIEHCILKGCTIARDYNMPECRLSGDIDLYVMPEKEEETAKFFKEQGMTVESRPKGKQDFKVISPASGVVEVHVQLYNDNFSHVVLNDKFGITEDFVDAKIDDFLTVKALGPNDTLNFLTAHFIKHFVREGSGIRQITDLLAYVNKHKEELDFEKYFAELEEVKFKKLVLNVFGIGVKYFKLNIDEYSLDMVESLLDDIEEGENFGFGDDERDGFLENFLYARAQNDAKTAKAFSERKKRNVLNSVFLPRRKYLINKGYKYLQRWPALYPVAYLHRLASLGCEIITRKKSVKKSLEFAGRETPKINQRLEMMKQLGII